MRIHVSELAPRQLGIDMQYELEISLCYCEPMQFWSCFSLQQKLEEECYLIFFQAEDGIRDDLVTGVQTCALPISSLLEYNCFSMVLVSAL